MEKPLDPQVEAVEHSSVPTPSTTLFSLDSTDAAITTPQIDDELDWEIEVVAQRYSHLIRDTKTDGSQGCH